MFYTDAMEIKHFMGNSWFRHENPPAEEEEENWSPRKAFLSELFMAKVRFLSPQDFIIWAGLLLKSLNLHAICVKKGESLIRMYSALSFNEVKKPASANKIVEQWHIGCIEF